MMQNLIAAFPDHIAEAIEIAKEAKIRQPDREIHNVLICGMGGSGIGGSLVSGWLLNELKVPVSISKGYNIPAFVDSHTLVIGSSYSGNTEETLSAIEKAVNKGAWIVGVCSGGKLSELCEKNNFDQINVPGGNPPRTMLAYSLVQLLRIFNGTGLIPTAHLGEMQSARELINSEHEQILTEAKFLATHLKGKVGILYGDEDYAPVLIRARQQFNENSKELCWHHALPEMNHNELVGWGGGDDRFAVVFFDTTGTHPSTVKRIEITKSRIKEKTQNVLSISSKGKGIIEQSIYLINVVDWASLFLSEMKDVDPVDIEVIDYLKSELAKFNG